MLLCSRLLEDLENDLLSSKRYPPFFLPIIIQLQTGKILNLGKDSETGEVIPSILRYLNASNIPVKDEEYLEELVNNEESDALDSIVLNLSCFIGFSHDKVHIFAPCSNVELFRRK